LAPLQRDAVPDRRRAMTIAETRQLLAFRLTKPNV
jgi:hypothetical protein